MIEMRWIYRPIADPMCDRVRVLQYRQTYIAPRMESTWRDFFKGVWVEKWGQWRDVPTVDAPLDFSK